MNLVIGLFLVKMMYKRDLSEVWPASGAEGR